MSNKADATGRSQHPADRWFGIMTELRRQIVSGKLHPGARLPTRREMAAELKTTLVTIQKALDHLQRGGFVTSHGRGGSFVSDRPPHLYRFGMVFPERPTSGSEQWHWSKFWSHLARAGEAAARAQGRDFVIYSGVDDRPEPETDAARQLVADAAGHRLAGLITAGPFAPKSLVNTIVTKYRIPIIQVAQHMQVPTLRVTSEPADAMVIERFKSSRCQSVAILMPQFIADHHVERTIQLVRSSGISVREGHVIGLDPREPRWVRHWIRVAMDSNRPPQGLWITDDNLVAHAAMGLADAGVVVDRDLTVIAQANLPLDEANPVGFQRYGINLHDLMSRCIVSLIQYKGGKPSDVHDIVMLPEWMQSTSLA